MKFASLPGFSQFENLCQFYEFSESLQNSSNPAMPLNLISGNVGLQFGIIFERTNEFRIFNLEKFDRLSKNWEEEEKEENEQH